MYYYDVLLRAAGGPNTTLTYQNSSKLEVGCLVNVPLGGRNINGMIVRQAKKPKFTTKSISLLADTPLPAETMDLLVWMADYYGVGQSQALRQFLPSNLPKIVKTPSPAKITPRGLADFKLSPQQQAAVKQISQSLGSTFILHGETASGKTLVYRELVKQTLSRGQSVILLVPEIALTPQLAADFSDLTEQLMISHSSLSDAQRQRIWLYSLQQKLPKLLIGPRSTLFYPIRKLGLVIIDEAHEQSYKQEQAPRYQAQTVAAKLTQLHGAKLILGSATPRISDYWTAKTKKVPIIKVKRYHPAKPTLTVVDQKQAAQFSRSRLLSEQLIGSLNSVLNSGGQSLLYLNRRGTAAMAICSDCGWVPLCERCDLPMNLHHDQDQLICHQCGWSQEVPVNCPVCGSDDVIYKGAGTKAIEREVSRLLPSARLRRFDSDSPSDQAFSRLYQEVVDQKVDILIGTQGLANGLDLPALKLVGVVSADSELYLPDYTASERAFQLLFQVIGRGGRQGGGQVVIQTHNPDHPAIVSALKQDYDGFYTQELESRKQHGYPPFSYILGLIVRSKSAEHGKQAAGEMAVKLKEQFDFKRIMGPAPAFYYKRGGYFRHLLVVKSKQRPKLVKCAKFVDSQADWQADIDPVNLLF